MPVTRVAQVVRMAAAVGRRDGAVVAPTAAVVLLAAVVLSAVAVVPTVAGLRVVPAA
ncbi:MAG: hypothetical protein KF760_10830 [Candidatus Eremiobacteraeota bacterium]|nr:hypothetical protein [Candidatus Eremiobacteraeota bacterium]